MTTDITYIVDHPERAKALLTSLLSKPNLTLLLQLFTEQVQELEDLFFALYAERQIDTAQGAQLDQLGAIAGARRDGLDDETYRRVIRVQQIANQAAGRPEELLEVAKVLFAEADADARVLYYPLYPLGFGLVIFRTDPSEELQRDRAIEVLTSMLPLAVKLDALDEATPGYFGWDDDPDALGFDVGHFVEELL